MSPSLVRLESSALSVVVDPGRGSDVLSVVHKATGVELLFATPWRKRANDIRASRSAVTSTGSVETWLEQYRGGWQTLCPNAGAPRSLDGAPAGYHGEASVAGWHVVECGATRLRLQTDLFSVPLAIEREYVLDGTALHVRDTLVNLSRRPLRFDYAHHPAFGGDFLSQGFTIETGAGTFVNDHEAGILGVEPDSRHAWPVVTGTDGVTTDLSVVGEDATGRSAFGWLTDFTTHWASFTSREFGLVARLDWDGTHLPYAWLWQELNSEGNWPWYGRARVVAIEPSSTPTSGPDRRSNVELSPGDQIQIAITLTVSEENTNG